MACAHRAAPLITRAALPHLSPRLPPLLCVARSLCNDCYRAEESLNADGDWAEGILQAAGEDYIRSGVAWCNATDTMPLQCDHLVTSRARMSGGE